MNKPRYKVRDSMKSVNRYEVYDNEGQVAIEVFQGRKEARQRVATLNIEHKLYFELGSDGNSNS